MEEKLMRDIQTAVEEIGISGTISLGQCCKQTMKNWMKDINNKLVKENYSWRVVGRMEDGAGVISCITKERYEAIEKLL